MKRSYEKIFDRIYLDEKEQNEEKTITKEEEWKIIEDYYKEKGINNEQIESFNYALDVTFQQIINGTPKVIKSTEKDNINKGYQHKIKLENFTIGDAMVTESSDSLMETTRLKLITPNIARKRNMTLEARMHVDIKHTIIYLEENKRKRKTVVTKKFRLGEIPIMKGSNRCPTSNMSLIQKIQNKECEVDDFGYFIVLGAEKVLIAQEKMMNNFPFVFKKNLPNNKIKINGEMRCLPELMHCPATPIYLKMKEIKSAPNPQIKVSLPFVKSEIPLNVMFKAMGVVEDREIFRRLMIKEDDYDVIDLIRPMLSENRNIKTREDALIYISDKGSSYYNEPEKPVEKKMVDKLKYTSDLITRWVLPHIGTTEESILEKSYCLGNIVTKMCMVKLGRIDQDDRDCYNKKLVDSAGALICILFGNVIKRLMKDIKIGLTKSLDDGCEFDLEKYVVHKNITKAFRWHIQTGNWCLNKQVGARLGVSAARSNSSYLNNICQAQKLNNPVGREGKLSKPRQINSSMWGRVCLFDTPEGSTCGLIKHLACMARISTGSDSLSIRSILMKNGLIPLKDFYKDPRSNSKSKVWINGSLVGFIDDAARIADQLITKKIHMDINYNNSIYYCHDTDSINISTEAGRLIRPLLVVKDFRNLVFNDQMLLNRLPGDGWIDLMGKGVIEYLDVNEENTKRIAMSPHDLITSPANYTHCEINLSLLMGTSASAIPFSNHNPAPRISYQSAMGKQSIGLSCTNIRERYDTVLHVLNYLQKPIISTKMAEIFKLDSMPSGLNAVVMIGTYTGFNQEDAIVVNQGSIDRGMFHSTCYKTIKYDERTNAKNYFTECFEIPDPKNVVDIKRANYSKLGSDGIIKIGESVEIGDVVVGKTILINSEISNGNSKRDVSFVNATISEGIVDSIFMSKNCDGQRFVKIRIRTQRIPQIGDKLSSRHSQKGVCGMILPECDMPYTAQGIIPDLMINIHAIPSRMTIGQLLESFFGKASAIKATCMYGNPLEFNDASWAKDTLIQNGFPTSAKEMMFRGDTGGLISDHPIFIGLVYYQRLKHMVEDKIHGHSRGPIQAITRQPVEGRAKDGGKRFGEMERDCLIGHGTSFLISTLYTKHSDGTVIMVCAKCSYPAIKDSKNKDYCRVCDSHDFIFPMKTVHAFRLLSQELLGMGISFGWKINVD